MRLNWPSWQTLNSSKDKIFLSVKNPVKGKGHKLSSKVKEKPKGENEMAKIEIILKDDSGKRIGEQREYELEVGGGTLAEIEAAVEQFKRKSLPEIEKELLAESQSQEIKKNRALALNGTSEIEIKTLHGRFKFALQRLSNGEDYFSITKQCLDGYVSERLKEYAAYYSNRMSYEEVAYLIERNTGEQLLCDQSIWQIVVAKAAEISQRQRQQVRHQQMLRHRQQSPKIRQKHLLPLRSQSLKIRRPNLPPQE